MMNYCPQCARPLVFRTLDGAYRRVCAEATCGFVFWDNPVPVVAGMVEIDSKILLASNREWPRGVFSVITGYLERGETPMQAVVREVQEELGVSGALGKYIGHYSLFKRNQLILAYHIHAQGEIVLNDELSDYLLLSPQELNQLTPVELPPSAPISPVFKPCVGNQDFTVLPLAMWCWKDFQ